LANGNRSFRRSVGGDELLRRARQRRNVAAAVLIRVLRVAGQRDVAQGPDPVGATEGGRGRVNGLLRGGPGHSADSLGACRDVLGAA
jgi:hypothetical protein